MIAEATLNQTVGTLLRMHDEAFRQLGGVPEENLRPNEDGVVGGGEFSSGILGKFHPALTLRTRHRSCRELDAAFERADSKERSANTDPKAPLRNKWD